MKTGVCHECPDILRLQHYYSYAITSSRMQTVHLKFIQTLLSSIRIFYVLQP